MRLLSALTVLAFFMSWPVCAQAAVGDFSGDTSPTVDRGPVLPLGWLWPGGLLVGYISVDLKRQLQRRGW